MAVAADCGMEDPVCREDVSLLEQRVDAAAGPGRGLVSSDQAATTKLEGAASPADAQLVERDKGANKVFMGPTSNGTLLLDSPSTDKVQVTNAVHFQATDVADQEPVLPLRLNLPCAASCESFDLQRHRSKSKGSEACMWNLACLGSACSASSEGAEVKPQVAWVHEAEWVDQERSWSPLCNSNEPHSLAEMKKELEDSMYEFQIVIEKYKRKLGLVYDDSDGESLVIKNLKPGVLYDSINQLSAENWAQIEDRIVGINSVRGKSELLEQEILKADVIRITLQRPKLPRGVHTFCQDPDDPTVKVHAYDLFGHGRGPLACLSRTINSMSTRFGLFHTGVEVYGQEWYFGANLEGLFHGVQPMEPKLHPVHRYRSTVTLGRTGLTPDDFEELMPLVRMKWPSWSYQAMKRNCHSFSDFFCQLLGFPAAPRFGLCGSGDAQLAAGSASGAVGDARLLVKSCGFSGCMSLRAGEGREPQSPTTMREEVQSTPVIPELPSSRAGRSSLPPERDQPD